MVFMVKFVDGRSEVVRGVDNYQQEGPMTTFFQSDGRNYLDSWSDRVASYRTMDLACVRRIL